MQAFPKLRFVVLTFLPLAGLIACLAHAPETPVPPTTLSAVTASPRTASVNGLVRDANGPVAGATVRVQATTNATSSDNQGRFVLSGLTEGVTVTVTAWKQNYYVAKMEGIVPSAENVNITLRAYQTNDNPKYEWIPPVGDNSCASCKPAVTKVWLENDAHAKSATNPLFLTMYNGTDIHGNASPPTRYGFHIDYGRIPLRPDLTQPYYGPGYTLDFPNTTGSCAACHTPGAAVNAAYNTNPNMVTGADTLGVHCDFCHKVADVKLDRTTGLPFPNMPGVLSMDVHRPFPEDKVRYQLFFGTFDDDNVPQEDTNLPLLKESQFCAPCHFGVFWNTVVYNSFGEWLESPDSDPVKGKTCQECHTPAPTVLNGAPITNVAPEKGGVQRARTTIHAHTFPGSRSEELLENSVTMTTTVQRTGDDVIVEVTIVNDKTGHDVPTDSSLRNVLLVVSAKDKQGRALPLREGSTLPTWADDYAGQPGRRYAKILEELWTEVSPTGAYWNPTRVLSHTRIAAFAKDESHYTFAAPSDGQTRVEARLIFRRAFKALAQLKGWELKDVVMANQVIVLDWGWELKDSVGIVRDDGQLKKTLRVFKA